MNNIQHTAKIMQNTFAEMVDIAVRYCSNAELLPLMENVCKITSLFSDAIYALMKGDYTSLNKICENMKSEVKALGGELSKIVDEKQKKTIESQENEFNDCCDNICKLANNIANARRIV